MLTCQISGFLDTIKHPYDKVISMVKPSILEPGKAYTFCSYFEMTYEPDDILAEFSVSLQRRPLTLPKSNAELDQLTDLKQRLQRRLPYVSLTSEAARREVLIAPIVLALIDYTQAQLRIEYAINVSAQLRGLLDYYLRTQHTLLVIEAKNADLARGLPNSRLNSLPWINGLTPRIPFCTVLSQPAMYGSLAYSIENRGRWSRM